jgi:putative tryptophan/tyrosine transport system substrate-binding protein
MTGNLRGFSTNTLSFHTQRILSSFLQVISFLFLSYLLGISAQAEPVTIGISQIVEHPALEEVRAGIEAALESSDLKQGEDYRLIFKNAQANMATNVQIAQQLSGMNPAILVGISTPSAQALATVTRISKTPVIFAAVTDPVAAKLVENLTAPGGNITGVSDYPPLDQQIELIQKLFPMAKRIGIVFNPAEVNSVHLVEEFRKKAENTGFSVQTQAAVKSTEVLIAAKNLIGQVDILYIPQDNTVVSAIDGLIQLQFQHDIPLIASDESLVRKGVLAGVGASYFKSGQQVGALIIRLLKGEKPGDIPVEFPKEPEFCLNEKTARKLSIMLTDNLKSTFRIVNF